MRDDCFVYLVFGDSEIHYLEALFSISSLRTTNKTTNILVVCTNPMYFKNIEGLSTLHLTEKLTSQWLGDCAYTFNLKLFALAFVLENYHERLIFLDSDTIVQSNISWCFDKINERNTFLHEYEGPLSKRTFKRGYAHLLGKSIMYGKNRTMTLTAETPMYNSGLIGVHQAHIPALKEAAALAQSIESLTKWHTAEQLALGILLKQQGDVHVIGDKLVKHYWHKQYKRFIREQLITHYADLQQNTIIQPPIRLKRSIPRWFKDKVTKTRPLSNFLADYS